MKIEITTIINNDFVDVYFELFELIFTLGLSGIIKIKDTIKPYIIKLSR